jgi:hypothetical protein
MIPMASTAMRGRLGKSGRGEQCGEVEADKFLGLCWAEAELGAATPRMTTR